MRNFGVFILSTVLFGSAAIAETDYHALIAQYAAKHQVPVALADAVIRIESRYNAHARNGPNLGLGQINLKTAHSLGYSGSAQGLLNAETNLEFSMRYLSIAYTKAKGDICGTIMRYQNGLGSTHFTSTNRVYCAKLHKIMG